MADHWISSGMNKTNAQSVLYLPQRNNLYKTPVPTKTAEKASKEGDLVELCSLFCPILVNIYICIAFEMHYVSLDPAKLTPFPLRMRQYSRLFKVPEVDFSRM